MEAKGVTGEISFDGQMVTISRSGVVGKTLIGKGEKRIPVKSIQAVEWKPASRLVRGFIEFSIGGSDAKVRRGTRTADAGQNENAVLFGYRQQAEFEALRSAIEAAMVS